MLQSRYNPLNVDLSDPDTILLESFWIGQKSQHPYHEIWRSMRRYCYDQKFRGYETIGGKGLDCCKTWKDFWTFVEDVGFRPNDDNYFLYRIDKTIGYYPDNVFWGTSKDFTRVNPDNTHGFKGYTINNGFYQAQIHYDGHNLYLGSFNNAKAAQDATIKFLEKNNPEKLIFLKRINPQEEKSEMIKQQEQVFKNASSEAKTKTLTRAKEMLDMMPDLTWSQVSQFLWDEGFRTVRGKRWIVESLNTLVINSPGGDKYRKHKNRGPNGHILNGPVKEIHVSKQKVKYTSERLPSAKIKKPNQLHDVEIQSVSLSKIPNSTAKNITLAPTQKEKFVTEVKEVIKSKISDNMKYKFLMLLFNEETA